MKKNDIPNIQELEDLANAKNMSVEEYASLLIQYNTITSRELADELGVSQSRIAALKKSGKIQEITKGIFLASDAYNMRLNQIKSQSLKHSIKANEYHLIPTRYYLPTENDENVLLISKTRFADCLVMANQDNSPLDYLEELQDLFEETIEAFKENYIILPLNEQEFQSLKNKNVMIQKDIDMYNRIHFQWIFTSRIGINPKEYFDWIARLKTTLNNQNLIEKLDSLMNELLPFIKKDIEGFLKSLLELKKIKFVNDVDGYQYYSYDNENSKNAKLRIKKSNQKLEYEKNEYWEIQSKYMLPREIIL